jgi:hypothetical protein
MDHSGLTWRKSSHSGSDSGDDIDCVEVARLPHASFVRDSKNPSAGILAVPAASWSTFLADVQDRVRPF